MPKVNTTKMVEVTWSSPKGKFVGAGKEISEELGRRPESTDLNERHPFPLLALPSVSPHAHAREKALTWLKLNSVSLWLTDRQSERTALSDCN